MISPREVKFAKQLLEKNLLNPSQLKSLLEKVKKSNDSLVVLLQSEGYMNAEQICNAFSEVLGLERVALNSIVIDKKVIGRISSRVASHFQLIPVKFENNKLQICVANPLDAQMMQDLQTIVTSPFELVVDLEKNIAQAIQQFYGLGANTVEKIQSTQAESLVDSNVGVVNLDQEGSSIITFVNQVLKEANQLRATDIHIEPFHDELRVRFRVDGILRTMSLPSNVKSLQSSITTRIKLMANLDISEQRLPQDGRFKISSDGKTFDLRVSVLPTPYGESVNLRLLASQELMNLQSIGMEDFKLKALEEVIQMPHGIVLLTGPTGSGKSTTLYSCLDQLNDGNRKIITIEDPIEYQMKGITQIQIHPKIGLSFGKGLRSMLRHDPDIMMVGEIRDMETAEIAMRVALTGHLVFSTLHTNDAPSSILRLIDMGVEPFLVASSLNCVIAQRLIRTICQNCKVEDISENELFMKSNVFKEKGSIKKHHGKGCEACQNTGYKGRMAIHELFLVDESLRHLIAKGVDTDVIRNAALESKLFEFLIEDGFRKVAKGLTTVEEVLRVALN